MRGEGHNINDGTPDRSKSRLAEAVPAKAEEEVRSPLNHSVRSSPPGQEGLGEAERIGWEPVLTSGS